MSTRNGDVFAGTATAPGRLRQQRPGAVAVPGQSLRRLIAHAATFALLLTALPAADLTPEQVEFFESKIRPILVDACYKCHSVESGKSKADLRLDTRDALLKGGATGAAIVPGNPEKSLLIEAVRYGTEDLQMPPKDEGGKLDPAKIALLEQWVKMGAPDPRTGGKPHPQDMVAARSHWAFQPVTKPARPAVKRSEWVQTPVDAFVLAKLEEKKLSPSAPADARTVLRRVTYDLTGLPPTADEMDAFLRDKSPDAYAKVVERLLASPRYGERWGRFWLDVARYADTQGYLVGNAERRFAYSYTYRDYVIRAFNEDKPFDRFVVEQLAADRLSLGEDKSALAALGYLTLGRRFLGNQNDIIDDRIDVVTRGLMGLTVTCARCHDHKFDPVPTKDYYALHGIFASSEEPAEKPLLGPLVDSPAYQAFLKKRGEAEEKVKERARSEVEKFLRELRAKTGDYLLGVHDAAQLPKDQKFELFAGTRKLNPEILKRWQTLIAERASKPDPVLAPWFALAALPEKEFAEKAPALIAGWSSGAQASGLHDVKQHDPKAAGAPANAVVVEAFAKAGKPIATLKDAAAIYNQVFAEADKAWLAAIEAAKKAQGRAPDALTDPGREAVRQVLYADGAPANLSFDATAKMIKRQIDDKTSGLKREVEALNWTEPGAPLRAMALVDKAAPANSRVLLRGNPANKGPEAPRQFLEVLSEGKRVPFKDGSGRLELAEAIVDPKNPLTARVLVNRVWGWHFGAALVRTPSDFGVRTEAPVQRELLDWLTASFVEGGWSVKQLHRWIVLSATYRQSSDEHPQAAAVDPDNQLVHRFNRRRLEFEALRDTLLAVSGTLDEKAGGLPDDLTKEPFAKRRTVYGFIDRQNLPGMFRTFDFPNPDVSSSQRFATTVPQQALFMMNSPFAQEQARQLVRRAEFKATAADADKIRSLYRVLFQRAPERAELKLAQDFIRRPAGPTEMKPGVVPGWHYGYGAFDARANRVRGFKPLTHRKDARFSASETFPDPVAGHLTVSAVGGHPGRTAEYASVRRWVSPGTGTLKIEGTLGHAQAAGDGVLGRVVSSAQGKLGEWIVRNQKVETKLERVVVAAGETVDFIVEAGADSNSDSFTWAPNLTLAPEGGMAARTWNAKKDFDAPAKTIPPLSRWEELAQVLLLSNELAFVD
ncbi:PSD1 and planctomycete cytochrome C domain-containing protein [Horticoccus sp. 23ND18S-11]|uniref:PSD1 and planctomycete cytochrome C domain-containing protein n=1 Tax=Horticoccus sp. 23ND18S-11 TaxID=3391832 RepID=UPI0039C9A3EC